MPAEDPPGLFDEPTPPADTTTPATTPPATTPPADEDIFSGAATEATTPPADSATPTAEPATDAAADEFFGAEPATTEGAATPPADATETPAAGDQPAEEAAEGEGEDIFDLGSILREPGGLASAELRTWVDNTGDYSCRGRLVRFMEGKVRILKDNGRTTTVPLARLSASDLEFVNRQASAHEAEAAERVAESAVGTPLAAN
jgi:hypothetical protein